MPNVLQQFAHHGGWTNLSWTPQSTDPAVKVLFTKGGTLLLGIGNHGTCTLAWLDQEQRWYSIAGFLSDGTDSLPSLTVTSKVQLREGPTFAKEVDWTVQLTLGKDTTSKPAKLVLQGVITGDIGGGTGRVGIFTAEANPVGIDVPAPWSLRAWLRRLFHLPDPPRSPRR